MGQWFSRNGRLDCDRVEARVAITCSVAPSDPYSYSGELEKMRYEIDRLAAICGHLAGILHERGILRADDIERLTDYECEAVDVFD